MKDCKDRYACLSNALLLLKNQMPPREALIFIARYYFQLKLTDLEKIFRLDFSHISRLAQKAERKLKIRG
jgi:DNA-directed RNA polymerase specialized sigma subunit